MKKQPNEIKKHILNNNQLVKINISQYKVTINSRIRI